MEQTVIEKAADRIRQMELLFDALQEAARENPAVIHRDPEFQKDLQNLKQYYESGQWLRDYALDELGLLPQNLKRGVLAQDAVYNFLDGINTD